mgnify:CR=1 FL=1
MEYIGVNENKIGGARWKVVASRRFELRSQDPESRMIDHYTTGLSDPRKKSSI